MAFESVVALLQRHHGVTGVLLVGIEDGMVIAGEASGRDADTAAALAASLYRRTRIASADAGLGDARFVRLEAARGHLCATSRGDVVIVAMADPAVNLGRLRLDMLSAARSL